LDLENRIINIEILAEVAEALKDIKDEMVFVGGAVVSLYADETAADEMRPTEDIDMALKIINLSHWQQLQEKLSGLGFYPDPFGHAICSYRYKDIAIDIMSIEDGPLGPANPWYKVGFHNLWTVNIKNQEIKLLSAPCFLATKFEAFNSRGKDYRTSHDIEDIVYVLDNRSKIVDEILKEDNNISNFLKEQFQIIINKGILEEMLISHIHPNSLDERMKIVVEKINKIINL
jgi:predicted nucleotidyltransferase